MKVFNFSSSPSENKKNGNNFYNSSKNSKNGMKLKRKMTKKSLFNNLAEEDLEKYRQIINDPEALISADDPLGISRSLCLLCKLDCKR